MRRRFEIVARFWIQVDNNDDDPETTDEQFAALAKGDAECMLSKMVDVDYEDYEVLEVKAAEQQKEE